MVKIDFSHINDEIVYEAFHVEGNEAEALNDSYLELFELIGRDAMLKLFTHFHGDKIDCPMRLYWAEFIADLAKNEPDRRESFCPQPATPDSNRHKNRSRSFMCILFFIVCIPFLLYHSYCRYIWIIPC